MSESPKLDAGRLALYASIGGTLSLVFSVVYGMGFLSALRLPPALVPVTFADFANDAVEWLPLALAGVVSSTVGELFIRRLERGRTREEQLEGLPARHWIRTLWRSSDFIPLFYVVFFAAVFLVIGEFGAAFATTSLSLCWFAFLSWIFSIERVRQSVSTQAHLLLGAVVPAALYVFAIGWTTAVWRYHSNTVEVQLARDDGDLWLLRTYESGILCRKDRTIVFLPWSDVVELRAHTAPHFWFGLVERAGPPVTPE